MIKRTLVFSNPSYLSLKNNQLRIVFPEQDKPDRSVPIEDIGVLILEHPQITITHGCMASLLANNAALITCDATHMPTGLLLPLDGSHTQSERYRYQIEATVPLKKQLWQQTVQHKINNQAALLHTLGYEAKNMTHWAKSVRSGDPDNFESRAAIYYWQHIYSGFQNFNRDPDGYPPNNLLNYGYAILRAVVARALVSSGLLPTLGIFHKNKYNAYCLADDIMEPYRPFVDQLVHAMLDECPEPVDFLDTHLKTKLLQIPQLDVYFEDITSPLLVGVSRTTASLARCFEGTSRKMIYPALR